MIAFNYDMEALNKFIGRYLPSLKDQKNLEENLVWFIKFLAIIVNLFTSDKLRETFKSRISEHQWAIKFQ